MADIYERLDANLKPGEKILIMSKQNVIVRVENNLGRGAYAEVVDGQSQYDGGYVYGDTPSNALWHIENKLAALAEEVVIH